MNRIVIYESQTGFTQQYAQWIAEALGCSCQRAKEVQTSDLAEFDQVIFGGWIMGNGIVGLEKLRASTELAAIFAVGSSPASDEVITAIKEANKLKDETLFYMQGGFKFDELKLPIRLMLKTLKKSASKKQDKTPQEEFMAQALGTSFDSSSKEQIEPLIEYLK